MVPSPELAHDIPTVKAANPLAQITEQMLAEKLASDTLDFGEDWLRLTCNIPARSSSAAVPEADWDALETAERIPPGQRIAVGADFAFQHDTTAIVPLWLKSEKERIFGDPEILTPPRDHSMLDVELIKEAFERINDRNPITLAVCDKSRAQDIVQWLSNDLGVPTVVDRPQRNDEKAIDYEAWMQAMREKTIRHTGHREFRRHVLNAIARKLPGGRVRFDRPSTSRNSKAGRQERRVIDALDAAASVYSVATSFEPPKKGRVVSW
jgi:phage terminase large subunit-like protein